MSEVIDTQGFYAMQKLNTLFLILSLFACSVGFAGDCSTYKLPKQKHVVSMFWCGTEGTQGCYQSKNFNDINQAVNYVFVAFAVPDSNGALQFEVSSNFSSEVKALKKSGKKVILSIGGQNSDWSGVLNNAADTSSPFYKTLKKIVDNYGFNGVDIDIENSATVSSDHQQNLITLIQTIRSLYGKSFYLTLSPEWVTVAPSIAGAQPQYGWNNLVNVLNQTASCINFVQPQSYADIGTDTSPYNDKVGTYAYYTHIYDGWVQPYSGSVQTCTDDSMNCTANGYVGLSPSRVVLGLLTSEYAGSDPSKKSPYYIGPNILMGANGDGLLSQLKAQYKNFAGIMGWDSFYDAANGFYVSNSGTIAMGLTPKTGNLLVCNWGPAETGAVAFRLTGRNGAEVSDASPAMLPGQCVAMNTTFFTAFADNENIQIQGKNATANNKSWKNLNSDTSGYGVFLYDTQYNYYYGCADYSESGSQVTYCQPANSAEAAKKKMHATLAESGRSKKLFQMQ